jgi:hypothetical protein
MPSQETQWYKDVRLIQMLDDMRKQKMAFMAKCYFCGQKSEGIKAVDYRLYAVCPNHDVPNKDINVMLESQTSFEE